MSVNQPSGTPPVWLSADGFEIKLGPTEETIGEGVGTGVGAGAGIGTGTIGSGTGVTGVGIGAESVEEFEFELVFVFELELDEDDPGEGSVKEKSSTVSDPGCIKRGKTETWTAPAGAKNEAVN